MKETKKPDMWAILLRIGVNTNAKPGDCRPYDMEDEYRYHEELFFDKEVWCKVTEYLPTQGINTVVIDMNEGVKLDSHPELAVPGSLEKAEFINYLKENSPFSVIHGNVDWNTSKNNYYSACFFVKPELMEVFKMTQKDLEPYRKNN